MALTERIRAQFANVHGVSLHEVSQLSYPTESEIAFDVQTHDSTLDVVGRGHTSLGNSVDPDKRDRRNLEIIRNW
jgi:hypothetical protein